MPYLRLWCYQITPGREVEFARAYGPDGDWDRLFRRAAGYAGTELLHPLPPATRPVTIDRWDSAAAWQAFLEQHGAAYRDLGQRLAPLCIENVEIGAYECQ